MKKLIGGTVIAFALTFSLVACGGQQNASTGSPEDSVNNSTMSVDTSTQPGSTIDSAMADTTNMGAPIDTAK